MTMLNERRQTKLAGSLDRRSASRWIAQTAAPASFLRELPLGLHPLVGQLLWSRGLTDPAKVENLPVGIAVIAASGVANGLVSTYLYRRAAETDSPALAGDATHLRTDAWLSLGVLVALVLVQVTGIEEIDAIAALLLALAILWAGVRLVRSSSRILVDESLPREELEAVREAVEGHGAREIAGFHKLRTRRAGSRRYIDMHVQFRSGTSLDRAHEVSHELQRQIGQRIRDADVLIHLEPDRGGEGGQPSRPGLPTGD